MSLMYLNILLFLGANFKTAKKTERAFASSSRAQGK